MKKEEGKVFHFLWEWADPHFSSSDCNLESTFLLCSSLLHLHLLFLQIWADKSTDSEYVNMRKQDLAILMLSAFGILLSSCTNKSINPFLFWFFLLSNFDFLIVSAWGWFLLPWGVDASHWWVPNQVRAKHFLPPIVTNLNDDGKLEVFVTTHDFKI